MVAITADGNFGLPTPQRSSLFTLYAIGDFGGGSVTLESTPNGTDWVPTDVSLSGEGAQSAAIVTRGLRAVMSGSTDPDLEVFLLSAE